MNRTSNNHGRKRQDSAHRQLNQPLGISGKGNRLGRVTAILLHLIGFLAIMVSDAAGAGPTTAAAGRLLVAPKAGLPEGKFAEILAARGSEIRNKIGKLNVHIVDVPVGAEDVVMRALARNPALEFAERDRLIKLEQVIPNDPRYDDAWHLSRIEAPYAWRIAKGHNVVIAVLDTGVNEVHPDLSGKLVPGWNVAGNNGDTSDVQGHGTLVAGTTAATSNNGIGVTSVAWHAMVMPIRVTDRTDGWAFTSDIASGLEWATDHGAHVANISYDVTNSMTVSSAAQRMRLNGGVVVVAAGNDGIDPGYGDNPDMISVSATTSNDSKASWSNYGNFIDVGAPGTSILTTNRGGGYGNWNGTSFASPAAAGVVALIKGANPSLTPDEVETVLESSADKVAGDWHPYYGHGRVNAAAAVQMAMAMDTIPVDYEVPVVNIFSPVDGATVNGIVQVEVNASDNVAVSEVSLYADGQFVATDNSAPYQFSWDSTAVNDGNVTLTVSANDSSGNQGQSADVVVKVVNQDPVVTTEDITPPVVVISNPANGSTVSRTVSITATATDDTSVALLELYIDGVLRSTVNGQSISFSWNTRKVSDGTYTIEVVAFDLSDNSSMQTVQVQVGGSTDKVKGKGRK